ncbi:hypothetical protein [Nonomuraea sp. NPDC048916]|uniref:hypothetical protein n=1 Tax=Nonomuraea sp. NPDC048916 TaxID=3154232 RepID=UPI0034073F04
MERARQLVGEMLVYCFVVVLVTGAFLTFFYTPSGETVPYSGAYEPLQGIPMSAAYESVLNISFDVRGGQLMRHLHHESSSLLVLGAVVWVLLGRFRYVLALLGLALSLFGALTGYASVDDLLADTFLSRIPIPIWYAFHLLAALTTAAVLLISSRKEAARHPRTPAFIALTLVLTVMAFWL